MFICIVKTISCQVTIKATTGLVIPMHNSTRLIETSPRVPSNWICDYFHKCSHHTPHPNTWSKKQYQLHIHSLCPNIIDIRRSLQVWFMVFNATFNNISVISWRLVLLVEETGVPGVKRWPNTGHWQTLSHNVVSRTARPERGSNSQL